MRRTGCDGCANRLIIRGAPLPLDSSNWWHSAYYLQYRRDGLYSVYKQVAGGGHIALVGWTASSAIRTGDAWNVLRVVAQGTHLSFYINGTLVWSGADASLSEGEVGVGMYRDSSSTGNELRVDWARLCTLPCAVYVPTVLRSW